MKNFEYFSPETVREALNLSLKLGPGGAYLGGGTDLIVRMKEGLESPSYLVDLKKIQDLKFIKTDKEGIYIGSNTTLREVEEFLNQNDEFPGLKEAVSSIGSYQIRTRATLVGNIVSSSPSADTAPILLAYDSEVIIVSLTGERREKLTSFFVGPRKNILKLGEIVKAIFIPHPGCLHKSKYLKLGRRAAVDLAIVGVGAVILKNSFGYDYRVALGAVAPTPVRLKKLEEYLHNKILTSEYLEQGLDLVYDDVSPIDDLRASKQYRLEMCRVLTKRVLLSLWEDFLILGE